MGRLAAITRVDVVERFVFLWQLCEFQSVAYVLIKYSPKGVGAV